MAILAINEMRAQEPNENIVFMIVGLSKKEILDLYPEALKINSNKVEETYLSRLAAFPQ